MPTKTKGIRRIDHNLQEDEKAFLHSLHQLRIFRHPQRHALRVLTKKESSPHQDKRFARPATALRKTQ